MEKKRCLDIIFRCEESVYDRVVGHLCAQEQERWQPMQVINVDMQDDLEDATLGSLVICELLPTPPAGGRHGRLPGRAAPGGGAENRQELSPHRLLLLRASAGGLELLGQ